MALESGREVCVQTSVLLKWENRVLFEELRNELCKLKNTHTGKVYFKRERYKALSKDTGGEVSPKVGITAIYIFIRIDLFVFGWSGTRYV